MTILRILLVDDSLVWQSILSEQLQAHFPEAQIFIADNLESAVKVYETIHPDCVVCDWFLPGVEGNETVAKLSSLDPTVPVIGVTATLDDDEMKALGFVSKAEFQTILKEIERRLKRECP